MQNFDVRTRFQASLLRLAMLGLLLSPTAHASPLHDPKRLVEGRTVILNPLFHWWTNKSGIRPLAAWAHLTGSPVETNTWGWIIEAQVEHTDLREKPLVGRVRLLLRNPPVVERAEFERLSAELKALNAERGDMAGEENADKQRADAIGKEQSTYRKYGLKNRSLDREDRVAKAADAQAKAALKPLDEQIQELKKQLAVYPNPDHYEVDCFALDTGRQYSALPLFDHGTILK